MSKIILKDNTEIEVTEMTSLGNIRVKADTLEAAAELKEKFTAENISKVTTTNDAGLEVGHYEDQVLTSITADLLSEGGVMVAISLRDKTDFEKLEEDYTASKELYDGALADIGAAISEIAGGEA